MVRAIAFLFLLIPGIISAMGIKLMRDTLFNEFHPIFIYTGIQFTVGLILFLAGLVFITGFIVHRDRKRQRSKKSTNEQ
ncbi:Protein of unknown function [Oceanobacillus limi]|uniref:DUF2627 domain-containing protein n=1 Tax=Oceanobacillus limi TaxID=930131 RepID=A0A1H9ZMU8_9BACI|nr:DUF2627 domain-containing protein [Oceanobacillus limi]SES82510.1 Protein of unknown function [Oceanobacillus limi]